MSHRDSWPGPRPSFQVPPIQQGRQVGSPLSQPQHGPPMPESRGSLFGPNYRTAPFSALNQSGRHIPSPPPAAGAYSHSRTPSFTHNAQSQGPTPSSAPLPTSQGPALNLRTNPYALKDLPPGPSPQPQLHGSQVVSMQARNEANHSHNQYAQFQDTRRDALFDRFRERGSDPAGREREQRDREQQHREQQMLAQQQHRYGQHTPPVTQPQFAPPDRSGPTPLSHQAYAPPPDSGLLQHPDSRHQQQLEYQQELQRRDYERERQRRERMEQEARYRQEVQAQRVYEEGMRARYGNNWEPPQPPNK
jgi:hypothetical protein